MCAGARSVGQRAPRPGWPGNREMSAGRWGHPAATAPADKEETSSINAPPLRATCATRRVLSRLQTRQETLLAGACPVRGADSACPWSPIHPPRSTSRRNGQSCQPFHCFRRWFSKLPWDFDPQPRDSDFFGLGHGLDNCIFFFFLSFPGGCNVLQG